MKKAIFRGMQGERRPDRSRNENATEGESEIIQNAYWDETDIWDNGKQVSLP